MSVDRAGRRHPRQTRRQAAAAGSLHRRALGVPDLVFFIVAASAPLTAVAGGQAATYLVTGNKGIPFLFIPLAIVLGIFAVGYAAMSRHVADAGAFYTYVVRGLGRIPGVGAAFVALVSYNAMQIGIYGLFGVATAGLHGRQDRHHARLAVVVPDRRRRSSRCSAS